MAGRWYSKEEKRNIFSERKYSIHTETIREWTTLHDIAGGESPERSKHPYVLICRTETRSRERFLIRTLLSKKHHEKLSNFQ
ncbi:hypothetical protein [Bacillus atrophaeus]|uniref:hypothetical protein n=1 Tax=Bacillus atrophaeus TaxID=1452 RepID=UPI002E215F5E|nr:hypothetical protein [Bacillus atrophaeus]